VQFLRTAINKDEDIRGLKEIFGMHPMLSYMEKRTDKHPNGADITICENSKARDSRRACVKARDELCILWDGTCVPCCWDADGLQPIGNIAREKINHIWQGAKHQEFQQRLEEGKFEDLPLCRDCSSPVVDGDYAVIELINSWVEMWKRAGSRIMIAPGSQRLSKLLKITRLGECKILAFCDSNPDLHGTSIEGIPIRSYQDIESIRPDVIMIHSAIHNAEIYDALRLYRDRGIQIFEVFRSKGPRDSQSIVQVDNVA